MALQLRFRRPSLALAALLTLHALFACACAHFPENAALERPLSASEGYRFGNLRASVANTDSVLVCVSFSGGGARAGAMAYGVVRTLAETRIAGGTKPLLEELDLVSAASGGAFPAAYLAAFGGPAFLRDFRERVLLRDLGMEMFWRAALCPYQFVRICSPWFNRSDLAAELYAETIFGSLTYFNLQERGRPFVVLNATDLLLGRRFEFTQDQFDGLGSSLGQVPLARAVAASAAFPVLLTPVAFRDTTALEPRYSHLIDGGVVDNLGLGHVLESYQRGAIHELIEAGKVETLVFVMVNARNRADQEMSTSPQAPGAASVLSFGLGAAIDRRTDAQALLLAELSRRRRAGSTTPAIHLIEVDLENLPDPIQRERLLGVETTFGLPPEVIDELIEASAKLLARHPDFLRVRAALH